MSSLSWSDVVDQPNERLEFGACHVREAWRRHKSTQQKFMGLEKAFSTSDHRLTKLLQEVGGNPNALNHPERGQALYAAVWFPNSSWAILCNPTQATLVPRQVMEEIPVQKGYSEEAIIQLKTLFDEAPENLKREFNSSFYQRIIRPFQQNGA